MIPYSRQTLDKKDIDAIIKTLKSKFLTQGPQTQKFEKIISKKTGANYSAVVNSATSALHISCMALGFKKMIYCGLHPILLQQPQIVRYI